MTSCDFLMNFQFGKERSLQAQIRELLINLITSYQFGDKALPSCRKMAKALGVSRNTVVLVYESLVDDAYLESRERSGFFVHKDINREQTMAICGNTDSSDNNSLWHDRINHRTSLVRNIEKPKNWHEQPYPFVYGQIEKELFPIHHWRACSRISQQRSGLKDWVDDYIDSDDPMLIEQIRHQILSKRGIFSSDDEILITIGTQNSLYILSSLLTQTGTTFGIEEPGYTDARNIFETAGASIQPLLLDNEGVTLDKMSECDYVFTTPSHQVPTNITMSIERREQLINHAKMNDFIIIEDDYDSEINTSFDPSPALKSLDTEGRVIYVGSLSKSLSPGLRIGFIVADKNLITEARALRRLMYRHPPANNQRTAALFMSQGHYNSYLRSLRCKLADKAVVMYENICRYLPQCKVHGKIGGSSFWLEAPDDMDCNQLAKDALASGIVIEPGDIHFHCLPAPKNFFRLGFTVISIETIPQGLSILGDLMMKQSCKGRLNNDQSIGYTTYLVQEEKTCTHKTPITNPIPIAI